MRKVTVLFRELDEGRKLPWHRFIDRALHAAVVIARSGFETNVDGLIWSYLRLLIRYMAIRVL